MNSQNTKGPAEATSHKEFLQWAQTQAGSATPNLGVDERLVEAQGQADLIRVLVDEEIPKAVVRCCDAHRLMVQVTGEQHLSGIAYEQDVYRLRTRVIWLLGHTVKLLEGYPLLMEDKRLFHNGVVLRKRALPTCSRCPYLQYSAVDLPRLCPTAALIQLGGDNASNRPS